jgi:hypothetical protein
MEKTDIQSDFSLLALSKENNPNYYFRPATWPIEIDIQAHKLFDNEIDHDIVYTRETFKTKKNQTCTIKKNEKGKILLVTDDLYVYIIRRDSLNNKPESDFSLIPMKKSKDLNAKYTKATWPMEIEQSIHDLFDEIKKEDIKFQRKTFLTKEIQICVIKRNEKNEIILCTPRNYNYFIKRDSFKNKRMETSQTTEYPNEICCCICLVNKVTHICLPCSHFNLCQICSDTLKQSNLIKCPLCKAVVKEIKKVFI